MAVQTSYSSSMTGAFAGLLYGDNNYCVAMYNNESSAEIAFGRAVMFGSATDPYSAKLPVAETAIIAGIVAHSHNYVVTTELGTTGLKVGVVMNVLRRGRIWVVTEDACVPGDRIYVRGVAGGDPEFLGGIVPADDSTDTVVSTVNGMYLTAAAAGALALIEVNFTGRAS